MNVQGTEILTTFELAVLMDSLDPGDLAAAGEEVRADIEPYMETVEGEGIDDVELAGYLDPLGALVEPSHGFGLDMAAFVTGLEES